MQQSSRSHGPQKSLMPRYTKAINTLLFHIKFNHTCTLRTVKTREWNFYAKLQQKLAEN